MKRLKLVFSFVAFLILLMVTMPVLSCFQTQRSTEDLDASFTALGQDFVAKKSHKYEVLKMLEDKGLTAKDVKTTWGENSLVVEQSPKMLLPIPADPRVGLVVVFNDGRAISFSVYRVRFFF